jgi:hypothetical protein
MIAALSYSNYHAYLFFSAMTIKETMMPVINSYHGATTYGQTSPGNRPYQQAASPGPSSQDLYNQSPEQSYVQATSPQPSGFQALTMNRVRNLKTSYRVSHSYFFVYAFILLNPIWPMDSSRSI